MAEGPTSVALRNREPVQGPDDASTLPYEWYVDRGKFELELQRIFSRTWQYVGHIGRVAAPGDFVTTQLGELPIIVTRDEHGELHALRNVCCHRGAEVVLAPAGNRKTLQCHYHAWSYALDGRLVGAPRSGTEPGFRKEDFALRPLRLETYGPFVFVNPDDDAPPLREVMGGLPSVVEQTGVNLDALRCRDRREYRLKPTGRSSSRTSSSATTARSRIRVSRMRSTSTATRSTSTATSRPSTGRRSTMRAPRSSK